MKNRIIRKWVLLVPMLLFCLLAGSINGCGMAETMGGITEAEGQQPNEAGKEPVQADEAGKEPTRADEAEKEPMQPDEAGKEPGQPDAAEEEPESLQSDVAVEDNSAQAPLLGLEIDEAVKKELVEQLLQEHGMDVSVLGNDKEAKKCTFTLPEGFTEAEDMPGMYVGKHYPVDLSTIYYKVLDEDISLQLMTEQTFREHMETSFLQMYGMQTDVGVESFEAIKIDGYPAFRILCSFIVDEVKITQLIHMINADKSYAIVYSQTDEYDGMEEFEASALTIRFE